MRRHLLTLSALALLVYAVATPAAAAAPVWLSKPRPYLARFVFSVPGCYSTGSAMGEKGRTITVSRASTRTCSVGGSLITCLAHQACVETQGILAEPARTNYVLNSGTHPKTAEATSSLPTGAGVCWHAGSGTMTVTAGSATVTGLSCTTVAAGTNCTFTVTVAGTLNVTTTSGTTGAQCEIGAFRSSYIPTTGTAATRQADQISVANPQPDLGPWCVEIYATPYAGHPWHAGMPNSRLVGFGSSGANTIVLYSAQLGGLTLDVKDAANALKRVSVNPTGFADGSTQRITMSGDNAGALKLQSTTTTSGAGTGIIAALSPTILVPFSEFGGYVSTLNVYRTAGGCQ